MIMEIGIIVVLSFGGWFGYTVGSKNQTPVESRKPSEWSPKEHRTNMLMCKSMCSKKVLSYDVLTGDCSCRVKKSRK